ncbi:DNA-directed RNA polymerase subunit D [Candidatus Micrarchaeota archaeon]|nr:DNA-directed RNA polymerase subunit D [Candidatus Micrarchaeota archaeon]
MKMKIEVLKEKPQRIELKLTGFSQSLANALRRTIISDLPAFAIDRVDFYENNTVLFNEYLANRLGLIPLTYDDSLAEDTQITFTLNAESIDEHKTVYAKELVSTDPKVKVYSENIPVVKLGGNQRLRLEAVAVKGTGKKHAKFQCALSSMELLDEKKGDYKMFIESYNNVPAKQHLKTAIEILKQDCDELKKELK